MKFTICCSCGAVMKGTATPGSSVQKVIDIWSKIHSGAGHTRVDSNTSVRARRKAEEEAMIADS